MGNKKRKCRKRKKILISSGLYEKQSIKVLQYDIQGNLLNTFNSISEACKQTNTNRTSLSQCLNNKLKTANNFIWKRKT